MLNRRNTNRKGGVKKSLQKLIVQFPRSRSEEDVINLIK